MAILSGNTDLLEKAKLEKRIAALESEHRSFNKGLGENRMKLCTLTDDIEKLEIIISKMEEDRARFMSVVQRDSDGNAINALKLDKCEFTDTERMGKYLQSLARSTNTQGEYVRIGEIYGFPVSIKSERTLVDGVEAIRSHFVVEGQYRYTYNNGYLAMSDTQAACMNFLNALERLPEVIKSHQNQIEKLRVDLPTLQAIAARTWGKEDELKALKAELATLDQKITSELAPKQEKQDFGEDEKSINEQIQSVKSAESQSEHDDKSSLVAEPQRYYRPLNNFYRSLFHPPGL